MKRLDQLVLGKPTDASTRAEDYKRKIKNQASTQEIDASTQEIDEHAMLMGLQFLAKMNSFERDKDLAAIAVKFGQEISRLKYSENVQFEMLVGDVVKQQARTMKWIYQRQRERHEENDLNKVFEKFQEHPVYSQALLHTKVDGVNELLSRNINNCFSTEPPEAFKSLDGFHKSLLVATRNFQPTLFKERVSVLNRLGHQHTRSSGEYTYDGVGRTPYERRVERSFSSGVPVVPGDVRAPTVRPLSNPSVLKNSDDYQMYVAAGQNGPVQTLASIVHRQMRDTPTDGTSGASQIQSQANNNRLRSVLSPTFSKDKIDRLNRVFEGIKKTMTPTTTVAIGAENDLQETRILLQLRATGPQLGHLEFTAPAEPSADSDHDGGRRPGGSE